MEQIYSGGYHAVGYTPPTHTFLGMLKKNCLLEDISATSIVDININTSIAEIMYNHR